MTKLTDSERDQHLDGVVRQLRGLHIGDALVVLADATALACGGMSYEDRARTASWLANDLRKALMARLN